MGRIFSVFSSAIMIFYLLVHPLKAQQRNMTIGMTNWAENIAVANLWKILLAERGYQAELRTVDRVLAFSGLARDDIDLGLETWGTVKLLGGSRELGELDGERAGGGYAASLMPQTSCHGSKAARRGSRLRSFGGGAGGRGC